MRAAYQFIGRHRAPRPSTRRCPDPRRVRHRCREGLFPGRVSGTIGGVDVEDPATADPATALAPDPPSDVSDPGPVMAHGAFFDPRSGMTRFSLWAPRVRRVQLVAVAGGDGDPGARPAGELAADARVARNGAGGPGRLRGPRGDVQ